MTLSDLAGVFPWPTQCTLKFYNDSEYMLDCEVKQLGIEESLVKIIL